MPPDNRPTNDNQDPARAERWEETPQGRRVMNVVSAVVIVGGIACIWAFATPATLRTIGIGLVVIFVGAFVMAAVRWLLTGRA